MRRDVVLGIVILGVLALAGLEIWYLPGHPGDPGGAPQPITVGNMLYEYSGLIFVADHQGFFAGNGLNVTLKSYTVSVASIKGLENRDTDITIVPEYSIVTEAFDREPISVIGNIDKSQSVFLISRRSRGVENVSDLKGARIGASMGTIGEFYLGRFLGLRGIGMNDVQLVNLTAAQFVDAFTNGSVDAVVVVYKYIDQSRERLGDDLVTWPIQSSQPSFTVLACRKDWGATHRDTINRFLESMKQAEGYATMHPSEARAIIQEQMGYAPATIEALWPDHQFSLSLDQSLVLAMEDEARWMIANNLTNATVVPDFRSYMDTASLTAVKPGSVNIIG